MAKIKLTKCNHELVKKTLGNLKLDTEGSLKKCVGMIRCGDGKVGRFLLDGAFIIVLKKKEEIAESETTRKLYQSDNRIEGGL